MIGCHVVIHWPGGSNNSALTNSNIRTSSTNYMDMEREMGGGVGGGSPDGVAKFTTVEALHRGGGGGDGSEALLFGDKLCTRNCALGK